MLVLVRHQTMNVEMGDVEYKNMLFYFPSFEGGGGKDEKLNDFFLS